jgi:hypothetical protein
MNSELDDTWTTVRNNKRNTSKTKKYNKTKKTTNVPKTESVSVKPVEKLDNSFVNPFAVLE